MRVQESRSIVLNEGGTQVSTQRNITSRLRKVPRTVRGRVPAADGLRKQSCCCIESNDPLLTTCAVRNCPVHGTDEQILEALAFLDEVLDE